MGESPERLEPWSIHGHSEIASNRTHKSGECTVFHRTVAARVNCHNIKFFAKAKPQECFSSSFAYNKTHALLEKATTDGTCQAMVLGCTFSAIARTPVSPRGNGPAMQMTPTLLRVCLLHTHTHTHPPKPTHATLIKSGTSGVDSGKLQLPRLPRLGSSAGSRAPGRSVRSTGTPTLCSLRAGAGEEGREGGLSLQGDLGSFPHIRSAAVGLLKLLVVFRGQR